MLLRTTTRFLADEDGATAIEYGLIATLMAVALIAAFVALGDNVTGLFGSGVGSASSAMGNAISASR
ncbi:MAG: Flp family type IVb pilin [Devosia sp.]|jgi:pilus assembly protein Flp/PilA|nr:Flp family type IVb pilin [Devosia sp.]